MKQPICSGELFINQVYLLMLQSLRLFRVVNEFGLVQGLLKLLKCRVLLVFVLPKAEQEGKVTWKPSAKGIFSSRSAWYRVMLKEARVDWHKLYKGLGLYQDLVS